MKQWETLAEACALDDIITLIWQHCADSDGSIDTSGVRSVERVMNNLKAYELIHEVQKTIPYRALSTYTIERLNSRRCVELTDYIREHGV